jgi:ferritin-like metal-binding protein YciE
MPLDRHFIVHLQEMYATEHDFCDYLNSWVNKIDNSQLKTAVTNEVQDINQQLNNLQQCLSQFNEFPERGLKSPLVQAFQQEDTVTMQHLPQSTAADMDVHLAMTDLTFGQAEIGIYEGLIDMAQALNCSDAINLLQDNLQHEQQDVQQIRNLLPTLINQSSSGRMAA